MILSNLIYAYYLSEKSLFFVILHYYSKYRTDGLFQLFCAMRWALQDCSRSTNFPAAFSIFAMQASAFANAVWSYGRISRCSCATLFVSPGVSGLAIGRPPKCHIEMGKIKQSFLRIWKRKVKACYYFILSISKGNASVARGKGRYSVSHDKKSFAVKGVGPRFPAVNMLSCKK